MGVVTVSESDLKSSRVVTPAFYAVEVTDAEDKPSKDGTSINTWYKGVILYNLDNGSKEFEGTETPFLWLVSHKAIVMHAGLWAQLGITELTPRTRIDTSAVKGRIIGVFIENELYNGVMQNKMTNKYKAIPQQA